jgi:hypothetical protein
MLLYDGQCLKNVDPPGVTVSDGMVDPNYQAAAGDLVYLDDAAGHYKLCNTRSIEHASVGGLVTTAASGKGKKFVMSLPGWMVRLKRFGTLSELKGLGKSHVGYLGTNGRITATPNTGRDVINRRLVFLPKRFSDLEQADLDLGVLLLTDPAIST